MSIKGNIRKVIKFFNVKEKVAVPMPTNIDGLLAGKTALIVGGSSGIGLAIAERFVSAGSRVIIAGTNEDKLRKCCEKFPSEKVRWLVIDLNNVSVLKDKFNEALALFSNSQIDILVNSAGYHPKKIFFDITEDDFDRTINTNVKGVFFMSQVVGWYMMKNHIKGHILNISSSSALRPAWSPYEISKWAIRGMTVGLADTLIPHGIIVNAIAPGPTATPMIGKNADGDLDFESNPSGRLATPVEIANLALVLVSDMGNLVVGDTLYATGGSGVVSLHQ